MSKFLTLLIAGGVSGALYSLIAAGLVVSYTATGIFNLGYGAVCFTCALLYYELHTGLGWPIAAAAIVTICVFAPLLGLGLDRAIFRNLTRASESSKVMATVGILIALPAIAKWLVDILVSTAKLRHSDRRSGLPRSGDRAESAQPLQTGRRDRADVRSGHRLWRGRSERRCPLVLDAPDVAGPADAGGGRPPDAGPDARCRPRPHVGRGLGHRYGAGRHCRCGRSPDLQQPGSRTPTR